VITDGDSGSSAIYPTSATLIAQGDDTTPHPSCDIAWYAVYACTRHEKRVKQQLEERRIDCFLPLYRSVRRWKDRRKELELVLFPGYVFVQMNFSDKLRVLTLPSVVGFVTFGDRPAVIDGNEIESLRSGIVNGVCLEPHPYLTIGRRVRIKQGPLAGSTGILMRKKDRLRVVLSLEIIMRSVAVEIDSCDLEWIPQSKNSLPENSNLAASAN
jgi:transcription antitermination factor NusG